MINCGFTKVAAATASVVMSVAVLDAKPAQAALLTYDFTVNLDRGPLSGQSFWGEFSYDDADITGVGLETVSQPSISFEFLGETFDETRDANFESGFPIVFVEDGILLGLDYNVLLPDPVLVSSLPVNFFTIFDSAFTYGFDDGSDDGEFFFEDSAITYRPSEQSEDPSPPDLPTIIEPILGPVLPPGVVPPAVGPISRPISPSSNNSRSTNPGVESVPEPSMVFATALIMVWLVRQRLRQSG
jgi:hypothetical protein